MFWNDNNFGVCIVTNFWIDNRSFIMQNSGYSDVIVGFNWTCNCQLSVHIDFTTLNWLHFIILADIDAYTGNFTDEDIQIYELSDIGRFVSTMSLKWRDSDFIPKICKIFEIKYESRQ